jgi:hypothetical protein
MSTDIPPTEIAETPARFVPVRVIVPPTDPMIGEKVYSVGVAAEEV